MCHDCVITPDGPGFRDVLGCELPADHVGTTPAALVHHAPGVARYATRVRPVGDRRIVSRLARHQLREPVFGWKFAAWGPPGFYQIEAKGSPVFGALQGRRELVKGQRTVGFECTFAVESIDATEKAVKAAGGKIVLDRSVIAGVGTLMFFADPDGNVFGAMQYDAAAE